MMQKSLSGHFLIAAKKLRDPNFYQSVVLMVEHNESGAMGLVVNRPATVTVSDALRGHFELPETGQLIFIGGPVERQQLFILHNSTEFDGDESSLVPGVYVGNSPRIFEEIVQSSAEGKDTLQYRIFAGYAGWSAGQLEGEMERGDWYSTPASQELVFGDDPYVVWETVCRQIAVQYNFLPNSPGNAEFN